MTVRGVGNVLGITLLAAGAIAGGTTARTAAAGMQRHAVVHIKEVNDQYGFHPAKLTVHAGTRVTWTNNSDAPHTVTGTHGWSFASKMFTEHHSVSVVFKKAGTYHYMCSLHPYMKGVIIVKK